MDSSPVVAFGFESIEPASFCDKASGPIALNLAFFQRQTSGDRAFQREIIGLFLQELPSRLANIGSAQTDPDWKMALHTLRGAALGIGADALAEALSSAEALKDHAHLQRRGAQTRIEACAMQLVAEVKRVHNQGDAF
jgi:HPt (histidine-containing phosphotransfer) domain-containing protein